MTNPLCPKHNVEYTEIPGYGVLACPVQGCDQGTTLAAVQHQQDKAKRQPAKPKVIEADLQSTVIEGLQANGYEVMETGKARARVQCPECSRAFYPTGWQGNTPGVTDLFIRGKHWPVGIWLAVELKGSSTPVTEAQQALSDRGGSHICWSWDEVWQTVKQTEERGWE